MPSVTSIPADKLCLQPYGMPCLAHRYVFAGRLDPCTNCAGHLDRVLAAMVKQNEAPKPARAPAASACLRIRATEP